MTDYSKMTDGQINWKLSKIRNTWTNDAFPTSLNYTHDWQLAGELLEEMPDPAIAKATIGEDMREGWVVTAIIQSGLNGVGETLNRAICEAWLAWKEQG